MKGLSHIGCCGGGDATGHHGDIACRRGNRGGCCRGNRFSGCRGDVMMMQSQMSSVVRGGDRWESVAVGEVMVCRSEVMWSEGGGEGGHM